MHMKGARVFVSAFAVTLALVSVGLVAQPTAYAESQRVQIVDNEGVFNPIDARTGEWGYAPMHVTVTKGDTITFFSPGDNRRPHSVTSIEFSSRNMEAQLSKAGLFNSSPDQAGLIRANGEWELTTENAEPGHYLYYCYLHPWMVGTITVLAP